MKLRGQNYLSLSDSESLEDDDEESSSLFEDALADFFSSLISSLGGLLSAPFVFTSAFLISGLISSFLSVSTSVVFSCLATEVFLDSDELDELDEFDDDLLFDELLGELDEDDEDDECFLRFDELFFGSLLLFLLRLSELREELDTLLELRRLFLYR